MTTSTLAAVLAAPLIFSACVSGADRTADVPPTTIRGTIHYDGPAVGRGRPLAIAVYGSLPPTGPPVRTALLQTYEFPQPFQFDGLPPGTYFVGASIDVDRADRRYAGMLNPELDPFGYVGDGAPITLGDRWGVGGLDITLEDPQ